LPRCSKGKLLISDWKTTSAIIALKMAGYRAGAYQLASRRQ
jgi:hypothetical protein